MPFTNGTNNFFPTKWSVNTAGLGTHTTLASAMASASLGDTIWLEIPVTENVTMTPGVNICATLGAELTPQVSITGKLTMTGAGVCTIAGIKLITNSDYFLAVTGSASSFVYLKDCYLYSLNNTGINFSSSGGGNISAYQCTGDIGTTGIGHYTSTATGAINYYNCQFTNGGGSSTASTSSSGGIGMWNSIIRSPLSCSGTSGISLTFCDIGTNAQNATSITTSGTGATNTFKTLINSGTASAISVGSGTTVHCHDCTIASTNTNAITGSGTLDYSNLDFYYPTQPNGINVTTTNGSISRPGIIRNTSQPAFLAHTGGNKSNVTGDGTTYTILFDTVDQQQGGTNYASGTGIFTAPYTGWYIFQTSVFLSGLTVAHTQGIIEFNFNGSAITSWPLYSNFGAMKDATASELGFGTSIVQYMSATDTVKIVLIISNGTKVVTVSGGAGSPQTNFSGYFLG
jgi:hypothetical protein